jgi:tight adherence protein B
MPGAASSRRRAELEWVEALAAETRAGRDPVAALVASSSSVAQPDLLQAAAAATSGADAAVELRAVYGASELVLAVAACWDVAQGSGAGLAASLTALADSAREAERVRRDLHAGTAEPRATALVLAALPIVGLMLGGALGADPWSWLLGTSIGLVVLAAGVALEAVGAVWSWRIVRSLESEL